MVEDREEVATVGVGETALDIKMMAIEITETGVIGEETGDIEGITEIEEIETEIEEIGEMAYTIEGEEEEIGDTTTDMMVLLDGCLFIFSVDDR